MQSPLCPFPLLTFEPSDLLDFCICLGHVIEGLGQRLRSNFKVKGQNAHDATLPVPRKTTGEIQMYVAS